MLRYIDEFGQRVGVTRNQRRNFRLRNGASRAIGRQLRRGNIAFALRPRPSHWPKHQQRQQQPKMEPRTDKVTDGNKIQLASGISAIAPA